MMSIDTQLIAAISVSVSALALMWTIGWSAWLYKQTQKPRIRVILSLGLTVELAPTWVIYAKAVNTGFVPVTIENVALQIVGGDGSTLLPNEWISRSAFPKLLKGGESVSTNPAVYGALYPLLRDRYAKYQNSNGEWPVIAIASEASGQKMKSSPVKFGVP